MEERKSVFRHGAECGLPMGLYMTLMSLCWIYSDKAGALSVVLLALLVLGPVVIYRFQRRYAAHEGGAAEYAALWMHGILTVIYGALITGAVTLVVLQWVRPTFLYDQARLIIDTYDAMPESQSQMSPMIDGIKRMVADGLLPKPVDVVFSMFWLVTFSGSVLSAITAAFARMKS